MICLAVSNYVASLLSGEEYGVICLIYYWLKY